MADRRPYEYGDIVAIPLPNGRVGYARVFRASMMQALGIHSDAIDSDIDFARATPKFVAAVSDSEIASGAWRVVAHVSDGLGQDGWIPDRYVSDSLVSSKVFLHTRGQFVPAPGVDPTGLEPMLAYDPIGFARRIAGDVCGDETYRSEFVSIAQLIKRKRSQDNDSS